MHLPGIQKIWNCPAKIVSPDVDIAYLCHKPVSVRGTLVEVPFFNTPECSCVEDYDTGDQYEKATLRFLAHQELTREYPLAFVILDANGQYWLLGRGEPPFLKLKQTRRTGTPSGDPAAVEVEVELSALVALIPCSVTI